MLSPYCFKICAWYDNEYAYSYRLLDLLAYMHKIDNGLQSGYATPQPQVRALAA